VAFPTYQAPPKSSGARTLYISPTGSDSQSGSATAPRRQPTSIEDIAQSGDIIIVDERGGEYGSASTQWNMDRDFSTTNPITFRARNWDPTLKRTVGVRPKFRMSFKPIGIGYRFEGIDFQGNNSTSTGTMFGCIADAGGLYYSWDDCLIHDYKGGTSGNAQAWLLKGRSNYFWMENSRIFNNGKAIGHDHGMYLEFGHHVWIVHNAIYSNPQGYGIQFFGSHDDVFIYGNTIAFNRSSGITIGGRPGDPERGPDAAGNYWPDRVWIERNIIVGHVNGDLGGGSHDPGWGITFYQNGGSEIGGRDNLIPGNVAGYGNVKGAIKSGSGSYANTMTGDPRFVANGGITSPTGNYHLQSGSAAQAKVSRVTAFPFDLEGLPRSATTSLGAYRGADETGSGGGTPTPTPVTLQDPIATGQTAIPSPRGVAGRKGDNTDRFKVLSNAKAIYNVIAGVPAIACDLSSIAFEFGNEGGVLGYTIYPDLVNGEEVAFISYTNASGHLLVDRITSVSGNHNAYSLSTRVNLLTDTNIDASGRHYSGVLRMNSDKALVMNVGDANDETDATDGPQSTNLSPKGKTIQWQNPTTSSTYRVIAKGKRNAWRGDFDYAATPVPGTMWPQPWYDADVGSDAGHTSQGPEEEVNYIPGGRNTVANLGWPNREGNQLRTGFSAIAGEILPIRTYPHDGYGKTPSYPYRALLVSGPIRDPLAVGWVGKVLVGDTRTGALRLIDPVTGNNDGPAPTATIGPGGTSYGGPVDFSFDQHGQLYISTNGGLLRRVGPRVDVDAPPVVIPTTRIKLAGTRKHNGTSAGTGGTAPAYRATGQANANGGTNTQVVVGDLTGKGLVAGDAIYITVALERNVTLNVPAGFEMAPVDPVQVFSASGYHKQILCAKRLSAGDITTNNFTFSWDGVAAWSSASWVAYSGVRSSGSLFDGCDGAVAPFTWSTTIAAPTITTTGANSRVMVGGGNRANKRKVMPAGWTSRIDNGSTHGWFFEKNTAQATAGVVAAQDFAFDAAGTDEWIVWQFGVPAEPTGGATTGTTDWTATLDPTLTDSSKMLIAHCVSFDSQTFSPAGFATVPGVPNPITIGTERHQLLYKTGAGEATLDFVESGATRGICNLYSVASPSPTDPFGTVTVRSTTDAGSTRNLLVDAIVPDEAGATLGLFGVMDHGSPFDLATGVQEVADVQTTDGGGTVTTERTMWAGEVQLTGGQGVSQGGWTIPAGNAAAPSKPSRSITVQINPASSEPEPIVDTPLDVEGHTIGFASGTSTTLDISSLTPVAGDLLELTLNLRLDATGNPQVPDWELVAGPFNRLHGTSPFQVSSWVHEVLDGETLDSIAVSWTGASSGRAVIRRIEPPDVDHHVEFDAVGPVTYTTGGQASFPIPGVTTQAPDTLIRAIASCYFTQTWSVAGFTKRTPATSNEIYSGDRQQATQGTVASATATQNTAEPALGYMLSFKSVANDVPPPVGGTPDIGEVQPVFSSVATRYVDMTLQQDASVATGRDIYVAILGIAGRMPFPLVPSGTTWGTTQDPAWALERDAPTLSGGSMLRLWHLHLSADSPRKTFRFDQVTSGSYAAIIFSAVNLDPADPSNSASANAATNGGPMPTPALAVPRDNSIVMRIGARADGFPGLYPSATPPITKVADAVSAPGEFGRMVTMGRQNFALRGTADAYSIEMDGSAQDQPMGITLVLQPALGGTGPGAIAGFSASDGEDLQSTIAFTPVVDLTYRLRRKLTSAADSTYVVLSDTITTSPYVATGLTNGTSYTFELVAFDSQNRQSPAVTDTAVPARPADLPEPTNVTLIAGANSWSINFTAPTRTIDLTGYEVRESTSSSSGPWTTPTGGAGFQGTSFARTSAATVQTWVQVRALYTSGGVSDWVTPTPSSVTPTSSSGDAVFPSKPTTPRPVGQLGAIDVDMTPPNPASEAVVRYVLQRSTTSTGPWTTVAERTDISQPYTDAGLDPAQTFYYRTIAYRQSLNSTASDPSVGARALVSSPRIKLIISGPREATIETHVRTAEVVQRDANTAAAVVIDETTTEPEA